jgi:trigger factor
MDMFMDGVAVEGGQAKNHQVYLNEAHYIPGFAEELIGLEKDATKSFSLTFTKEHYQKNLADKKVDITVKVTDVFGLEYPTLDDAFAKSIGQESMEKLNEVLRANLLKEAEGKEEQRREIAILDVLIENNVRRTSSSTC